MGVWGQKGQTRENLRRAMPTQRAPPSTQRLLREAISAPDAPAEPTSPPEATPRRSSVHGPPTPGTWKRQRRLLRGSPECAQALTPTSFAVLRKTMQHTALPRDESSDTSSTQQHFGDRKSLGGSGLFQKHRLTRRHVG
jgi:hypothetical protein